MKFPFITPKTSYSIPNQEEWLAGDIPDGKYGVLDKYKVLQEEIEQKRMESEIRYAAARTAAAKQAKIEAMTETIYANFFAQASMMVYTDDEKIELAKKHATAFYQKVAA